jgi:hypothetical protein
VSFLFDNPQDTSPPLYYVQGSSDLERPDLHWAGAGTFAPEIIEVGA